jgi:steroid delta-isomerase-like uncharacterized protein
MRTPREVVLAWVDAFNCHDAHAAAVLYREDAVSLQVPNGQPVVGRDATLTAFLHIMQAFPDNSTRVVYVLVDGPWLIIEWEFSGTYVGAFQGNPPNGGRFKLQGCELFQVVDGKIRHQRGYCWDKATWFRQPGIPLTGVQNWL